MSKPTKAGQKVKLTGQFLRNTGQYTGSEGLATFTVLEIRDGVAVVNQERADLGYWTAEELAADPSLKWRRINVENLYVVGTLDHRNAG